LGTGTVAISASEPVDALNRLNEIATRYCESQMFFAGCSLGIFEELSKGKATASELARRCGFDEDAGLRLMIALSQVGLLTREGDTFGNSDVARYLSSSGPAQLMPLLMWGKMFYPMWGHLDDAVREGSPRWRQTFGATPQEAFANMYKDPAGLRNFCGIMSAYSITEGQLLAAALVLSHAR